MTPYERQIETVKAHMGELRSDGHSVERLLADRAAEPTRSQLEKELCRLGKVLTPEVVAELERHGKLVSFETLMQEFGLTEADLEEEKPQCSETSN